MSEYIQIETEPTIDPDVLIFHTNLPLAEEGPEFYGSRDAMEEGSSLAQALAPVADIVELRLSGGDLTVQREPFAAWHAIVMDISAALKDFFL